MLDYGRIALCLIESADDFWCLLDELKDDKSGFIHNKKHLLQAYKEDRLYGLIIIETDSMYQRGANRDEIFCKFFDEKKKLVRSRSMYLLPCLCITNEEGDKIEIIWVRKKERRKGFGRKMVELLKEKSPTGIIEPSNPLPQAKKFWDKVL